MTGDERRVLCDLEEDEMRLMVERTDTEEQNRFIFSWEAHLERWIDGWISICFK